jgi:hypothetical protein
MPLPFAHFGHVLVDLPIFLGPVAALGGWLCLNARKGRQRSRR